MGLINDIYNFFELAATEARIGHVIGDPLHKHFYGFNFEEFESMCKSDTDSFPCMGLSDFPHSGLVGSFNSNPDNDTAVTISTGINVLILDNPESGNYAQEKDIYDALQPVCEDLILYIQGKVSKGSQATWPFLDKIDMSNISMSRVGPKGKVQAYGWKIFVGFRKRAINSNTNPFKAILG